MNGWDGWMNGMNRWMGECMGGWVDEWIDRWMNGWMCQHGLMDRWIDQSHKCLRMCVIYKFMHTINLSTICKYIWVYANKSKQKEADILMASLQQKSCNGAIKMEAKYVGGIMGSFPSSFMTEITPQSFDLCTFPQFICPIFVPNSATASSRGCRFCVDCSVEACSLHCNALYTIRPTATVI